MNAEKTIYQTPDGKNHNGYIIDGRTYNNPNGTGRVPIGSTVPTAGGTYTYTAIGGVKTPTSVGEDMKRAYAKAEENLSGIYDAKSSAVNEATWNAIINAHVDREKVNERYADANRAAYHSYVNASNPYGAAAENKAKLGLSNSGYSETSKMQLANAYRNTLDQNMRDRNEYLSEIDRAVSEAKYKGDIELANALAEYKQLVYQHGIYAAEAIAAQERAAYDAGIAANKDVYDRNMAEREFNLKQDSFNFERDMAEREFDFKKDSYYSDHDLAERKFAEERELERLAKALQYAEKGASNEAIARALGISVDELLRIVAGR